MSCHGGGSLIHSIALAACGIGRWRSRLAEGHRRRRREAALTAKPDAARSRAIELWT
jgi:hypothetical protein